jgi:hypothetical protein
MAGRKTALPHARRAELLRLSGRSPMPGKNGLLAEQRFPVQIPTTISSETPAAIRSQALVFVHNRNPEPTRRCLAPARQARALQGSPHQYQLRRRKTT